MLWLKGLEVGKRGMRLGPSIDGGRCLYLQRKPGRRDKHLVAEFGHGLSTCKKDGKSLREISEKPFVHTLNLVGSNSHTLRDVHHYGEGFRTPAGDGHWIYDTSINGIAENMSVLTSRCLEICHSLFCLLQELSRLRWQAEEVDLSVEHVFEQISMNQVSC